jgi:hypothetical protein
MISTQVGFITHLKGSLTKKRYTAATVFVDHYSRLKYIHLMTKLTSEETIEAKRAFEHFAKQHGVRILHYHCNNRAVQRGNVSPSVGSMPISKRALQKRPSGTFKRVHNAAPPCAPMLASRHPLGPLAICTQECRSPSQYFTFLEDGTSRLEHFSSIRVGRKMKHHHAFGCPVFALENDLAAGSPIPHWSPRTRLGVNLGSSPSHARNIYLVLNLHTGCVSPQYHCRFDNFFEMVRHGGPDVSVPMAWQQLSGLTVMTGTPSM